MALTSGTPALNNASELYTQLEALMPRRVGSFHSFASRYCERPVNRFGYREVVKWSGARCKAELNFFFLLRRRRRRSSACWGSLRLPPSAAGSKVVRDARVGEGFLFHFIVC